ncbi:MAG: lycopene cyclase family protein [Bacteroidota bacterium]
MATSSFDYAIIGAGAAGLHLALKMCDDPYFKDKSILILEKDEKKNNDKTWSFWEIGETGWDRIASKKWPKAHFYGNGKHKELILDPYLYKSIRAESFYQFAHEKISRQPNIHWKQDSISAIEDGVIQGADQYEAKHIFDSRVSTAFDKEKDNHHTLAQHFLGWTVEVDEDVFDIDSFTMMDYRLRWKQSTSFMYVLPFSTKKALFEYTLFDHQVIQKEDYEKMIKHYLEKYTAIRDYKITEMEQGVIPMSTYPFEEDHKHNITKIGTAGGWVRPSSGYSFKNADRYSQMVVENLKNGSPPSKGVANSRFRYYDLIFLNVLANRNDLGEKIFTNLYTKSKIQRLFRFLDEESTFFEDLSVMLTLNTKQFRKAFFDTL